MCKNFQRRDYENCLWLVMLLDASLVTNSSTCRLIKMCFTLSMVYFLYICMPIRALSTCFTSIYYDCHTYLHMYFSLPGSECIMGNGCLGGKGGVLGVLIMCGLGPGPRIPGMPGIPGIPGMGCLEDGLGLC